MYVCVCGWNSSAEEEDVCPCLCLISVCLHVPLNESINKLSHCYSPLSVS